MTDNSAVGEADTHLLDVPIIESFAPIIEEPADYMIAEKPSTEPIFAESVISMESYAIKMNALRLQHRLPDRTTNAFLKFNAEMAGNKKMPRSVNKLNKICTKSKNYEERMSFRSISVNADCSVFTIENQIVNVVKRKWHQVTAPLDSVHRTRI